MSQLPVIPSAATFVDLPNMQWLEKAERDLALTIPQIEDIESLQKIHADLDAWVAKLKNYKLQGPALGAMRRVEARIGQLLGKAERGSHLSLPHVGMRKIKHSDRSRFRTLARGLRIGLLSDEEWRSPRDKLIELINERDPVSKHIPTVVNEDGRVMSKPRAERAKEIKRLAGDGYRATQIATELEISETQVKRIASAEAIVLLNDGLQVNAFDKFRNSVNAGFKDEVAVNKVVQRAKLIVSRDKVPGAVSAVGTLMRVYKRANDDTLFRGLRIIRDAYGDAGLEAPVIDGISHLCQRYNGLLQEDSAIEALRDANGGVKGLLNKAGKMQEEIGQPYCECVAAAAVEIINHKRKGKGKLVSWWKSAEE